MPVLRRESMLAVTVDNVMSWRLCDGYTRYRVKTLFAGREAITALDVLEMDIPAEDRLWAVLRMVPDPILHEFACRIAEAVLMRERRAGREPDLRNWAAIGAKRKWLRGEIDGKELYAAREAAQDVAWCAAWYAAWYAARNAARSVAREEQCAMLRRMLGVQK